MQLLAKVIHFPVEFLELENCNFEQTHFNAQKGFRSRVPFKASATNNFDKNPATHTLMVCFGIQSVNLAGSQLQTKIICGIQPRTWKPLFPSRR